LVNLHFPTNNLLPAATDNITPPFPFCESELLLIIIKPSLPRVKHGPEMAQEVKIKSPPANCGVTHDDGYDCC
jgi:hypothetical protein